MGPPTRPSLATSSAGDEYSDRCGRRVTRFYSVAVPFEFDDDFDRVDLDRVDLDRVDLDAVWGFLLEHAYWQRWRLRSDVERQIAGAWRVVGCYDERTGSMVGFCRAISDGVSLAYLSDVYVMPDGQRRGLGKQLVHVMIEDGPGVDLLAASHR